MPFSVPPQVRYISNSSVLCRRSPFLVDKQINVNSVAGTTLYGVKHPGSLSTTKYALLKPGVLAADTAYTVPTGLNDMHDVAGAALTAANRLRLIAIKNGTTVLTRVGNDANAGAGEFQQTDANTLEFGDALVAGDEIELWVMDAADIVTVTGGALTAGREYEAACLDVMFSAGNVSIASLGN